MLIKSSSDIPSSEITPKSTYLNRRTFLTGAAAAGAVIAAGLGLRELRGPASSAAAKAKIQGMVKSPLSTNEAITPFKDVSNYNNYYEFSVDKYEPAGLAQGLRTHPWTVTIEGLVNKEMTLDVDAITKLASPEERIYRHRCVEGWSIVVPWVGFSLSALIRKAAPLGNAKFVEFTTLYDPKQMPGQNIAVLEWPYVEGLRLDEAMHPLAMLCFGMYGENLPNQDGAPLRIVVPWKYGFKSAKAIVKIRFTDSQPINTWSKSSPREYGFYSNVNPNVDHPRWSQSRERRLGEFSKRPTLMFNGYEQVASLYSGMDLKKYF